MKLAIIGASLGQVALYKKAKELGHEVVGFAWNKGVLRECLNYADRFYPISVVETDRIVDVCRNENVSGVVSNGSELLAEVVAKISTRLHLHGNDPAAIACAQDKLRVRRLTKGIADLKRVECFQYGDAHARIAYPCVVKPLSGSGKKGVSLARTPEELSGALAYAQTLGGNQILVEQYIEEGREVSVESMSYEGRHQVVQITDKVSTGAPHFVEIAHHQPSSISEVSKRKIHSVVPRILDNIGFENGASHIEFKVTAEDEVALIEVNPRGGGDEISSTLVGLSTDFDYVQAMIDVALGRFDFPRDICNVGYAGICFLCQQTERWVPLFKNAERESWYVKGHIPDQVGQLHCAKGNGDCDGYFVYRSEAPLRNEFGL